LMQYRCLVSPTLRAFQNDDVTLAKLLTQGTVGLARAYGDPEGKLNAACSWFSWLS